MSCINLMRVENDGRRGPGWCEVLLEADEARELCELSRDTRSCNKAALQHPDLSVGQRRVNTGGGAQSTEKKVEAASEYRQGLHGQQRLQSTARREGGGGGYLVPVPGRGWWL
jgi:hypothetical protein